MNGRQEILSRIRRAVRTPAPKPGHHGPDTGSPIDTHPTGSTPTNQSFVGTLPIVGQTMREWLPSVGESWDEQAALFAANAQELKADFFVCAGHEELRTRLRELAAADGWQQLAAHRGDLTDLAVQAVELPAILTDDGYDKAALERCDVGFTLCDALIAQTGSVLVTNRSAGGRSLSILPPHHVVLATRDQLVPDLPAAFTLLKAQYGADYPSLISFITGPSRTGDIERILVLGAHGPKKLSIFCV